jgi:hypothetical protein
MLTDTARKRFKFQVAPSDRQLWAIGMVAVQWTTVETYITIFGHALTESDTPERQIFDQTRAMSIRLDQVEALGQQKLLPEWQGRFFALINEARQVQELRDKIIHGMWGGKENSSLETTEAHGPSKFGKPNVAFSWKLNYGDILKVARRIDELQYQLIDYCFKANGPLPEGQGVMLSDALLRIQRKPNPA